MVHVAKLQKFGLWILLGAFLQPMIFATHLFAYTVAAWTPPKKKDSPIWPHYQGESLPKSKSFTGETTWEMFDFYYRRNTRIIKLTRIAWHQWVFNHWDCWNLKGLKSHRRAMPEETRCSRMERNAPAACGTKFNSTSGSMTVNETRFISILSDLSKVSIPSLWAAKPSKRRTNSTFGENLWPLFPWCSNSDPQLQPVSLVTLRIESNYLRSYPAPFRVCFKSSFGVRKEDWERLNKIYHYIIGCSSKKTRETFQSIKSFVKCRGAFPLGRPGAPGIQITGTLLESPLPGISGSTFLQFSTKGAKDMEARLHRNRRQIDEEQKGWERWKNMKKECAWMMQIHENSISHSVEYSFFFLRFCRFVSWCRPPCLQIESKQFPACTLTTPHCF